MHESFSFGKDYALTLDHWFFKFQSNWPEIQLINPKIFNEKFFRRWSYYLNGVAGVFESGGLGLYQFTLQKPSV